jgi:hypothetical protein
LPHHAFTAPHKDHVCGGLGKVFDDEVRDQGIKQQLFIGGKRTLNEALRQSLELEFIKLTARSSTKLQKTRALWRSQLPSK